MGLAFARSYEERPNFSLHMDFDGTHPHSRGTMLWTYATFLTLYGEPTSTLDYDYFGRISADDVAYLQRIAKETVADFVLGRSD
jgi:hypothetical protein